MNCDNARSSRASAPLSTTKRAPDIFAAVSKSIRPSCSPISKCSFGSKENFGFSPTAAKFGIVVLILAERNFQQRRVGDLGERGVEAIARATLFGFELGQRGLQFRDFGLQSVGARHRPFSIAAPISFDAALRRS